MTVRDLWVKPTTGQVIAALEYARDLVDAGWTQGVAHRIINGQSCFCVMGAVAKACRTIRLDHPIMWGQRVEIMGRITPGAWLRDAATAALIAAMPGGKSSTIRSQISTTTSTDAASRHGSTGAWK